MKRLLWRMIFAFALILGSVQANALVLTFDDISNTSTYDEIPDGYGGLTWDGFGVRHFANIANLIPNNGYFNGVVSGEYIAYNENGAPASIFGDLFDFNGAFLGAAWRTGLQIEVSGFRNSLQIYSRTVTVDTTGSSWFDFDFLGVDQLVFNSFGGTVAFQELAGSPGNHHFVMDNFTLNESSAQTPVPEPSSLILMLLGSGIILLRVKKYRR